MERDRKQLTSIVDLQANLCQFGQKVSELCDLESNRHLSSQDAYDEIRNLWLQLKNSRPEILDILAKLSEKEQLNT
ncbi:hypothetical protein IQ238_07115 [Pleurocapsales cyanobacterium LEGE 06147]|nr:hypothetical protein [Pleurocapsales cyanobacterium LEGE 06147]